MQVVSERGRSVTSHSTIAHSKSCPESRPLVAARAMDGTSCAGDPRMSSVIGQAQPRHDVHLQAPPSCPCTGSPSTCTSTALPELPGSGPHQACSMLASCLAAGPKYPSTSTDKQYISISLSHTDGPRRVSKISLIVPYRKQLARQSRHPRAIAPDASHTSRSLSAAGQRYATLPPGDCASYCFHSFVGRSPTLSVDVEFTRAATTKQSSAGRLLRHQSDA